MIEKDDIQMRNKIIGQPVYMYKGSRWLEMPKDSYVYKRVYNKENDTMTYYCKTKTVWFEALCILGVILCSIYIYYMLGGKEVLNIKCNKYPIYYDNHLYLNMISEVENYNVSYVVYDNNGNKLTYGSLKYKDVITRVKTNKYCESYTIEFLLSSDSLQETIVKRQVVFAIDKEMRNE